MQSANKSLSDKAFSHSEAADVESNPLAAVDNLTLVLDRHERVALLVECVGGLSRAARIAEASPATVNNWRKEGAALPIDGMLRLCQAAGLPLDWVASGHLVRPDLAPAPEGVPKEVPSATLIRLIDARVQAALQRREARP